MNGLSNFPRDRILINSGLPANISTAFKQKLRLSLKILDILNPTKFLSEGYYKVRGTSIEAIDYRYNNVDHFNVNNSIVNVNKYYEYVDIEVSGERLGNWDWEFRNNDTYNIYKIKNWPAPIIKNNNTLRVYTPSAGAPTISGHIDIFGTSYSYKDFEVGATIDLHWWN